MSQDEKLCHFARVIVDESLLSWLCSLNLIYSSIVLAANIDLRDFNQIHHPG
jgi:hypothetical protein